MTIQMFGKIVNVRVCHIFHDKEDKKYLLREELNLYIKNTWRVYF